MSNEFSPVSFSELCNRSPAPRDWIVENLLIAGGTSILASRPKDGKSLLTRHLIKSVLEGSSFLGLPVKQGRVCLLALEDIESELVSAFYEIGLTKETGGLIIQTEPITIKDIKKINAYLFENPHELLVIDTLARFSEIDDFDSYAQVGKQLTEVSQVARKRKTHILLTHHSRKGSDSEAHESILGSVAFTANVDNTLLLKRRNDDSVELSTRPRYGRSAKFAFKYSELGVEVLSSTDHRRPSLNEWILERTSKATEGLTIVEICDRPGHRREDVVIAVKKLCDANLLIRLGRGQKGDPYRYKNAPPELIVERPGREFGISTVTNDDFGAENI